MFKLAARLSPFVLMALLVACASNPSEPCPVSGVLGEAETKTVFRGAGTDTSDVVYKVTLSEAKIGCAYRGKKAVVASVGFDITVERGPAGTPGKVSVPYFVAVSRSGKAILAREGFSRTVDLGSKPRETVREHIGHVRIPFAEGMLGPSYEVIVGLQLTPAELAFNRERRGY